MSCRNDGVVVDNKFYGMWKEVVVVYMPVQYALNLSQ